MDEPKVQEPENKGACDRCGSVGPRFKHEYEVVVRMDRTLIMTDNLCDNCKERVDTEREGVVDSQ